MAALGLPPACGSLPLRSINSGKQPNSGNQLPHRKIQPACPLHSSDNQTGGRHHSGSAGANGGRAS